MTRGTGMTIGASVCAVGLTMVNIAASVNDGLVQFVTLVSGLFCTGVGGLAVIAVLRHGSRRPGRA